MTAWQQLHGVRALLSPDGAWLPISFGAVDAAGRSCGARAAEAVRWGVLAGLVRIDLDLDERIRAVDLIKRAVDSAWLHTWEQAPGRTQAEVLGAIDGAIALEAGGGR